MKKLFLMIAIGLLLSVNVSAKLPISPLIEEPVKYVINQRFMSTMTTDPSLGKVRLKVFYRSINQLPDGRTEFELLSKIDNFKDKTTIHLVQFDCNTKLAQLKLIGRGINPFIELSTEPWSDPVSVIANNTLGVLCELSCGPD